MAENRIAQLREIMAQGAARDEELQRMLEAFAADLLKELGDDKPPVWAKLEAAKGERQVSEHFVMQTGWLLGNLQLEVAPGAELTTNLRMRTTKDKTHEVGLAEELSQAVVIDPPDEKHRDATRKKLFDHIFAHLETQVRQKAELPAG